jgi:SAM-dependent methyltransferase
MTAFIKCANCGNEVELKDVKSSKKFLLKPIPPVDLFEQNIAESRALNLYPLGIYECSSCSLIQIIESPPASMFYDNYIYTSTSSPDMKANFLDLQESILAEIDHSKPQIKILDIGCNDGLFLSLFKGHEHFSLYGTDPSPVAKKTAEGNFVLHSEYFPGLATKAAAPYDLIVGTNSLAHIPNIGDCFASIAEILSTDGILVIEVSDFNQMVDKGAWDYIYHEHLYYYTKESLTSILASRGLEVFRIDDIATKGGSLRVFAKHVIGGSSNAILDLENEKASIPVLKAKYDDCLRIYSELDASMPQDATLYGYGACATGSVAISQHPFFLRMSSLIDDNISRQALFAPHWATQVVPLSQVSFAVNDIVVVFAWRFIESISRNIKSHCQRNQLPLPRIIGSIG